MGADLYRSDLDDLPAYKRLKEIGLGATGTLQDEWMACYESSYVHPYYFRDSYNESNLLSRIDLSYWSDLEGYCGPSGEGGTITVEDGSTWPDTNLYPVGAARLLQEIRKRSELLAYNVRDYAVDERDYFLKKYDQLIDFLDLAIKGGHTIRCSV